MAALALRPFDPMNAPAQSWNVRLNKHSGTPLYVQLKHHIVYLIGSGELLPGMALPSVRQLAAELHLAPATVLRTYADLRSQGLLIGRAGLGVFVTEFDAFPTREADHLASVRLLLNRVVTQVGDAGLSADEIIRIVRDAVARNHVRPVPRLVFVAGSPAFADLHRGYLQDALSDIKCDIHTVLLADLEKRADSVLDALEPIRCLVSVVGTFAELRRLVGNRATVLFPLVVDLTEETQSVLVHLPREATIGLVAEKHLLATRSALVNHYRGTEEGLDCAAVDDRRSVGAVLRNHSIIVHSAGAYELLKSQVRPGTQLIEMRYRPNAASIARLRALLLVDEQGAEPGTAAVQGHTD